MPDEHDYRTCADGDCARFPCRVYKEGRRDGFDDGFAAGFAAGYGDGYPDGYAKGFEDGSRAAGR